MMNNFHIQQTPEMMDGWTDWFLFFPFTFLFLLFPFRIRRRTEGQTSTLLVTFTSRTTSEG